MKTNYYIWFLSFTGDPKAGIRVHLCIKKQIYAITLRRLLDDVVQQIFPGPHSSFPPGKSAIQQPFPPRGGRLYSTCCFSPQYDFSLTCLVQIFIKIINGNPGRIEINVFTPISCINLHSSVRVEFRFLQTILKIEHTYHGLNKT